LVALVGRSARRICEEIQYFFASCPSCISRISPDKTIQSKALPYLSDVVAARTLVGVFNRTLLISAVLVANPSMADSIPQGTAAYDFSGDKYNYYDDGRWYSTPQFACEGWWRSIEATGYENTFVGAERHTRWRSEAYLNENDAWECDVYGYPPDYGRRYRVHLSARLKSSCPDGTPENSDGSCPLAGKNDGQPRCPQGNPINTYSGNKYQRISILGSSSGGEKLEFAWHYNSGNPTYPGSEKWRHSYARNITVSAEDATLARVRRDSGKTLYFRLEDGQWLPDNGGAATLERVYDADGAAVGWRFTTSENAVERYDAEGRLVSIRPKGEPAATLTYNDTGQLIRIDGGLGGAIQFSYAESGFLDAITLNDGRSWLFRYDSAQNVSQIISPDSTPQDLSDNPRRIFHYEDARFRSALTGITDQNGVRFATWEYDDQGRAIASEHAGGVERTELTFNADGSVAVTNPLGRVTTYHFMSINGVGRVTQVEGHPTAHCAAANQSYSYTPEGWVESKTDWNGNTTTFEYNDRGLVTRKVEAAGTPEERVTTKTWHPEYRLPDVITEPDRVIDHDYDDAGRLIAREIRERN
jgi:YD repeat-containing protein